jgi:hypothetical protein
MVTAKALPTVVLPQPGGPTTAAISLVLARQPKTLSCSVSKPTAILITRRKLCLFCIDFSQAGYSIDNKIPLSFHAL